MNTPHDGLILDATIPALELAGLQRRVRFLEAVLVQILRDGRRIKEWYSAPELAALYLPGLPRAAAGISRMAREQGWAVRRVACKGGYRHAYHFSSLPRRTFEAMIDRIVRFVIHSEDSAQAEAEVESETVPHVEPGPEPAMVEHDGVTTPAWVLPLMRLMRRPGVELDSAVQELHRHVPDGVRCPTREEALQVLKGLGLAG